MKRIFSIVFCFTCVQSFAQTKLFVKTFAGNETALYLSNTKVIHGLSFGYKSAADTNNTVFYIEDFKYSDIKIFEEKIKVSNLKICTENYHSKPGDFIFSIDAENEIIFYYHTHEEDY